MKKTRKILSILLALIMALSLCTVAFAVDDPEVPVFSGKCGENIDWSLTDGVLTITGTGAVNPLTREVEEEFYVDPYYDEEAQEWVDGHYETRTVEESYYPWQDAIEAGLCAQFGVDSMDDLGMKMILGEGKEIYSAMLTQVKKLVIGEGITAFGEEAFDGIMPKIIILPSTLVSFEDGLTAILTEELVVNNPAISFETAPVAVAGFAGELPWKTLDEAFNAVMDAYGYMMGGEGIYSVVELAQYADAMATEIADSIAAINANEDLTPEEKAAALEQAAAQEQQSLTWFEEEFGLTGKSLAALVADLLAKANKILGTSFTVIVEKPKVDEQGQPVLDEEQNPVMIPGLVTAGGDFELTEEAQAAFDAYQQRAEEAMAILEQIAPYALGTKPEMETEDIDEGTGEPVVIKITPTPWLTVYGAKDSTTQAACEISQVKFVALEDAKAAFDAEKAAGAAAADAQAKDGDSDASKKLITDAKAAIDAVAYDETKSPSENITAAKAASDAANAKLSTDLAAQREADAKAAAKDEDGGYSNNAFMKFIKKIIQWFKDLFSKIFK